MRRIQPIVEGHGEEQAAPVLLRRLRDDARAFEIEVGRPVRWKRGRLVKEDGLREAIRVALRQPGCAGLLVLLDADKDCPAKLIEDLRTWAASEASHLPCEIVFAKREYEAWFLASLESLRGRCRIRSGASSVQNPESVSDAKGALETHMETEAFYSERTDQARLTQAFDFSAACRCRSFRQMVKAFIRLARGLGCDVKDWPPEEWGVFTT